MGVVERGGGVPHVPAGGALLRLLALRQTRPAPRVPQLGGWGGAHMAPRDELGEALVHHGIHRVAQHAQSEARERLLAARLGADRGGSRGPRKAVGRLAATEGVSRVRKSPSALGRIVVAPGFLQINFLS